MAALQPTETVCNALVHLAADPFLASVSGLEQQIRVMTAISVARFAGEREDQMPEDVLGGLVSSQLSSVEFVQDYVQLHFDGPTLTVFGYPMVVIGENTYAIETPGYRDALCGRIALKVVGADALAGQELRLDFSDGSRITVALQPTDEPEIAMFQDPLRRTWEVW